MLTVNIGILAHVDAGKTSLTERLLFDTGTIDRLGSVDAGTTQTDTDEIERRRGITVRTAVAAFVAGSAQVNLIDTPGHSEFVAEVDRALRVLDGAILVVSAVEGVQAQTRVLMRSLHTIGVPTLIFVNKIDRSGARGDDLLGELEAKLHVRVVPMNSVRDAGTPAARVAPRPRDDPMPLEVLSDRDEELLAAVAGGDVPSREELLERTAAQTALGHVNPVFFGSARTGAGVEELLVGVERLLPRAVPDDSAVARGMIFRVERGRAGEKIGYLRLFAGSVRPREVLTWSRSLPSGEVAEYTGQITRLEVIAPARRRSRSSGGNHHAQTVLAAGNIGRIAGIPGLRVGDWLGPPDPDALRHHFPLPQWETVARAHRPEHAGRLHAALTALADQDPLINARAIPDGQTSVLLYGEIQKEIVAETLARDFDVEAVFEPAQIVHLERPVGVGAALEELGRNPFLATIGLRVEPAAPGSGVTFSRETELGALPLSFDTAIVGTVYQVLEQGLYGWPVTDCAVFLTHSGFDNATSGGSDFRHLTPLVLMQALARAGTQVYEPCHEFEVEAPADVLAAVIARLAAFEAVIAATTARATSWLVSGEIPARRVADFVRELPRLSGGEGVWWSRPHGDRPVQGAPPQRARTDGNPLKRDEYLRHLWLRSQ